MAETPVEPAGVSAGRLTPSLHRRLLALSHVALDMDGTIYKGGSVFACTRPFLQLLQNLRIGYSFLTNNPSKSVADYAEHLRRMGVPADPQSLYTSAQATVEHLRTRKPAIRRIFVLGTPSMAAEFAGAGFQLTADDPNDEPDAVVVGFDLTLVYSRVCRAAWWISRGKPFIATNPDRVCPTDQPTVLVDCGAICALLETATGRRPDVVMGKPDPGMLTGIMDHHNLGAESMAMVGDRLYTDILMARRAGVLAVLVLTGEATAAAAAAEPGADLIVSDLAEFGRLIVQARTSSI